MDSTCYAREQRIPGCEPVYKKIIEFWTSERESSELQAPPSGFTEGVDEYLKGLVRSDSSIQSKIAQAELVRAKRMLAELQAVRRGKICAASTEGTLNESNLMESEAAATNKVVPKEAFDGAASPADAAKKILVRLLRDVPSFVGADLKTYGPYKTEDVVLLPAQNTDALIKRGIATEIQRR